MSSKTVILVGGPSKGTRFRPLSLDIPKLLFPIAGKPMIYHHIEAAAKVPEMKEIILIGFFKETVLRKFIEETSKQLNISIRYINEDKVLGTAGGLFSFREQILEGSPKNIFVLHSDICCAFPLKDLLDFHNQHGRICTIMGTEIESKYANQYGCLVRDEKTAELLHYAEKPETFVSNLINCGVYVFSPQFFDVMGKTMVDLRTSGQNINTDYPEITRKGFDSERLRLEQDIFVPLAGTGTISVFPYIGFWRQIKNAGASVYCQELYLNHYAKTKPEVLKKADNIIGNVIIDPTASVDPTALIGPDVYIGPNVKIGKGVRIIHSIVLDQTEIKDHACVIYSIIGWQSLVGVWARIEGIPNYTPFLYSQDKRKGVTIFGSGAQANGEIIVSNCIVMPHKQLDRNYNNEIIL
ncbi:mannose-1-phosphate guanylyltransferase [Dictyostelium purpureum]|uniref:Mannose-1-phosphate guanylyltransferase n=1 Tax=Dictyostelium purpureum TaxID=5786 RepID=F1A590_DICPU|nr:mannose-1-phosphate guanylyltransferase [Dictyostelium purpureum]EGC28640.1 mannose-1-phosphate guanylyltransferase [Dictyostelium purpureum]|eukprot:XP_003294833.1 mannose-1-phosphate guanylyltransferase [Dictyostelium purpureum]